MTYDFTKSRVLLFDQDDRVLLFLTRAPVSTNPTRWVTPGGHVEPGESHLEAAVRELFEETGLQVAEHELGTPILAREFSDERAPAVFKTNYEEWFTLRTTRFTVSNANWTPEENVDMEASRWWAVGEIEESGDLFEPDNLVAIIHDQLGSR
ncbi:NUDIX hydrolase [Subtercola frigoramans]|uniref:8-oxo-dGTP pyrophosphatase MutT (NUDIX family) n=1 Tax=Subtercola frigoramans TaxID=120298 RepID=A0ABS2L757_9MICO|nr:NUDIX domain-containing protein [Subtercola frigoramans]MBM7472306.1 8-oxo-dGTP pyrophosphatase MutT (NUDIX family) [Subtercola frigoramans]